MMMKQILLFLALAPSVFSFVTPTFQARGVVGTAVYAESDENEKKGGFFSGVKNFFEELDAFGKNMIPFSCC